MLDRVLLLNDRVDLFEVDLHGEADILTDSRAQGGCFLFGAHLGSFEVVRAVGRHLAEAQTSLVMYEDNARKTNAVLHAINPRTGNADHRSGQAGLDARGAATA